MQTLRVAKITRTTSSTRGNGRVWRRLSINYKISRNIPIIHSSRRTITCWRRCYRGQPTRCLLFWICFGSWHCIQSMLDIVPITWRWSCIFWKLEECIWFIFMSKYIPYSLWTTSGIWVYEFFECPGNGEVHPVNGMLTCRIVINLFNRDEITNVLRGSFTPVVNHLLPNMMVKERKNTRIAFVRVLLHFSYCFYSAAYSPSKDTDIFKAEKLRCLSLFIEILHRENDPEILLNILTLQLILLWI